MYFHDRAEAGTMLAEKLFNYRYENTAILALSPGGVVVAEQIARRLHTTMALLLTSKITAPGDDSLVLGTIDQDGLFTYNSMISAGQMEEYMQEMRTWMEEEKLHQMYQMTTILGQNGQADPSQLEGRNIIIATDGVNNGISFDAALHFLNKIHVEKIIAAIPVGPAEVIERLQAKVDELVYLYIPESFFSVSHYYTDEGKISADDVVDRINNVVSRWN